MMGLPLSEAWTHDTAWLDLPVGDYPGLDALDRRDDELRRVDDQLRTLRDQEECRGQDYD